MRSSSSKSERAPKLERVELRATEAEASAWRAKASGAGLTLSRLVRDALDGSRPPQRRRAATDPALLRELAQIGNNLNQLARWANRDKRAVPALAIIARLIEIERELAALRRAAESGMTRAAEASNAD